MSCLPEQKDDRVIVGRDTFDDAGVFKLDEERALIQTVDFFTPIVDDPYWYGQIAAANALSDVYAMGGKPLTAMNIVCFPSQKVDVKYLAEILKGGFDKVDEADAVMMGGHSVDDEEPKYGLSVTGMVHPQRVKTNAGARPGDKIILTKPLGTGIISTALKGELIKEEEAEKAFQVMARLNSQAAELMQDFDASACTDITGFGLLGHGHEMAAASKAGLNLYFSTIPLLPGVEELALEGMVPGGAYRNRDFLKECVKLEEGVKDIQASILFDPQTSGGLLISLNPHAADGILAELKEKGIEAEIIGEVVDNPGIVTVYP